MARRKKDAKGGVFKRGKTWWIHYSHAGRQYKESTGRTVREAAEKLLAKRLTEIFENRFDVRKRCEVNLDEFAPRYMEWAKANKRSWERDSYSLKALQELMGGLNLERITVAEVERYKRGRLSGALAGRRVPAPATVNRELACLRRLMRLAVDVGVLAENHLAGKILLLKEPEGRVRYLKPDQTRRLLEKCTDHLRPIVQLALHTGMRKSELLGLVWDEVELGRGVVRLSGNRTKAGKARVIPLDADARRVLGEAHKSRVAGCPFVFHRAGRQRKSIQDGFRVAVADAELGDFRFHDLRHSFASALAMRGVPLQAIAELLGHATLSVTQRYAHLSPHVLQWAVEQAGAYFEGKSPEGVVPFPLAVERSAGGE